MATYGEMVRQGGMRLFTERKKEKCMSQGWKSGQVTLNVECRGVERHLVLSD